MSAETLRRAAALMWERCHGAVSGPWQVGARADDPTSLTYIYSAELVSRYPNVDPTVAHVNGGEQVVGMPRGYGINSNAEHIASWSPEVADQAAHLLTLIADMADDTEPCDDEPCNYGPCLTIRAATEFARAYLGEAS